MTKEIENIFVVIEEFRERIAKFIKVGLVDEDFLQVESSSSLSEISSDRMSDLRLNEEELIEKKKAKKKPKKEQRKLTVSKTF